MEVNDDIDDNDDIIEINNNIDGDCDDDDDDQDSKEIDDDTDDDIDDGHHHRDHDNDADMHCNGDIGDDDADIELRDGMKLTPKTGLSYSTRMYPSFISAIRGVNPSGLIDFTCKKTSNSREQSCR